MTKVTYIYRQVRVALAITRWSYARPAPRL